MNSLQGKCTKFPKVISELGINGTCYLTSVSCLSPFAGGSLVHVGDEIHLVDEHGKVVHVTKNEAPEPSKPAPEKSGWIAYAYWNNNGPHPIKSFRSDWYLPPDPATNHGQLLYLFNGITPSDLSTILQPVLQWGVSPAGGGQFWGVASWYVTGTSAFHTKLARINRPHQFLRGIITLTGSGSGKYNYVCYFAGIPHTTLTLTGSPQLVWAANTLESYAVQTGTDYPRGSTTFFDIYLRTAHGVPSVTWTPISDAPDNIFTTVNRQGASNARVTVKYPTP